MKKIIFEDDENEINFKRVNVILNPIFVKKEGTLRGMVVYKQRDNEYKWTIQTGGDTWTNGYHDSAEKCIKSAMDFGYEFFTQ